RSRQRARWPAGRSGLGRPRPAADNFHPRHVAATGGNRCRISPRLPLFSAIGLRMPATATALEQLGVPVDRLPRHIAIIMDGNGRWAQRRSLPRIEGHRRGVASVRRTVEECTRRGIEQLALYCLSSENWKRPQIELDFLMHLLEQYMIEERTTIMQQNIAVSVIGRRDGIPERVLEE